MRYRNIIILACIACVAVLLSISLPGIFEAVSERTRKVIVYTVVQELASQIDVFKLNEGRYPRSINELQSYDFLSEEEKRKVRELIETTQRNDWHDVYSYTPLTNGFSIVVHSDEPVKANWFRKPRRVFRYSETDGKTSGFNSP